MKKLLFSLGLSVTILLSVAFAQEKTQKFSVSEAQASVVIKDARTSVLPKQSLAKRLDPRKQTKEKPQIRYRASYKYKAAHNGKTEIILLVGEAWDDGSGYQMLIDPTHSLESFLEEDPYQIAPELEQELYDAASIKLPAGAIPEVGESCVMDFESDTILIDPGTYDLLITNPSYEEDEEEQWKIVYFANNGFFDDIELEADYTYIFEVYLDFEEGYDDVIFHGPYDLAMKAVPMPLFCNYDKNSIEVKVAVVNMGTESVDGFTVYYATEEMMENEEVVEKEVAETLKPGERKEVVFDETIEVNKDTVIDIFVGVYPLEEETMLDDNENEGVLLKKSVVDVPFDFKINEYDFVCENPDAWQFVYDERQYPTGAAGTYLLGEPLVSRCINLNADVAYRLDYEHLAGTLLWGLVPLASTYYVLLGKVEAELDTWDTIGKYQLYSDNFEENRLSFSVKESGIYAIAFVEDEVSFGMGVKDVSISEISAYDARMLSFTGLPSILPADQRNGAHPASIRLENYGYETIAKASVSVLANGTEIGKVEINGWEPDTVKTVNIAVNLASLAPGEKTELTATVTIEGQQDATPQDNSLDWLMEVSDEVMAYDLADEESYQRYGVGSYMTEIGAGIPFTISQKDTLTGMSVGWSEMYEDMSVTLLIYKWDAEKNELGEVLLNETVRRGTEAGQREYSITPRLLEPGSYMFGVKQQSSKSFGLISDYAPQGFMYIITNNPITVQSNVGTPTIRAIFGHDGKLLARDLGVSEISQPKETGVFTNEQPIVLKIKNNGYEAVVDAPVTVKVNETVLPSQTVSVPAYGETELTFKGDLSAIDAEFVLVAFTSLEGDENPANDTCVKTVHSLPAMNPYVMDFEYCPDFATGNELLPAWKSVDISGADFQFGFNGFTYPHLQEPVGFLVFPSGLTERVVAHGGDRCGIAFGSGIEGEDDDEPIECNAWLISPKLALSAGNAKMSFYIKSENDRYGLEKYNVMVSTTDDDPESFVKIGETREAPVEDWTLVNVDLSEYAGKEVHVAIQHVSFDVFALMIDDIVVGNTSSNEEGQAMVQITVWPNPAREAILIHAAEAIQQVTVFNAAGNRLYQSADNMNAEEFRYNVKNLNSGLYIARVKTAQGVAVVKFVVR